MNNVTLNNITQGSFLEHETYFPLRVIFDPSIGNNRFVGFYAGDTNLLEFAVDRTTGLIRKFQVVACDNYHVYDEERILPTTSLGGSVGLKNPPHNDCNVFLISVFNNCIDITISDNEAAEYYAEGQVLFGIDNTHNLVSIIITDVTEEDRSHIISELQCN